MPATSPTELIQAVLDAAQESGGSAVYLSSSPQAHPRRFGVHYLGEDFTLWVYIWTITHGGRTSLPDEFRIQMTTVESPLPLNPNGYTVLLGYYPDLHVFGGFDLVRHRTFTAGSPSVQIDLSALHGALQNGLGFSTKDNEEIAIGIREDQLLNYVLNSDDLHKQGADMLPTLQQAAALDFEFTPDFEQLSRERQRIVAEVTRFSRDAHFRRKVLEAYGNRCAVTRMQLRLVDAAHILPVAVEGSSDHTSNGIALSPTMHRAFDAALIYLDEDYFIRINEEKAARLQAVGLSNGLNVLRSSMNRMIHLPGEAGMRPRLEFVQRANAYRQIPGYDQ